jgi:membrane-anchored glycerophosphoryl diester phosphodiesterase (GDPDase)
LLGAMIKVGVLRHALGEKTRTTWIWFSLGTRVWRMVAATLLYLAVYCGLEIVASIIIGIVAAVMTQIPGLPPVAAGVVTGVLSLAAILAGIYILLRLFFFLPAVVVAENKVGVARAWDLGRGNVWRMVAVLVVVLLPVALVFGILFYATVLGTFAIEAARMHPQGPAQALAVLKELLPLLPVILGVYLLAAIACTGLVYGAMGAAYKAVTAPEAAPKEA